LETTETPSYYVYRIDASDVLSFVSPEWVHFAQSNEAPELTEANVVGKPIWDFITGEVARTLYGSLFSNLRSRRGEMAIPFRCDAPSAVRHMTLTLRSMNGRAIECEGRLDRIEPREPVAILSRGVARSQDSIPICSLCRRMAIFEEWLEVRAAIVRKRLFNAMSLPRLEETVCPECKCVGG
jgi:hypothetical protein